MNAAAHGDDRVRADREYREADQFERNDEMTLAQTETGIARYKGRKKNSK